MRLSNHSGTDFVLQLCVPFYASKNVKILTICIYFFVPTMALMYCYGSVFHMDKSDKNNCLETRTKSSTVVTTSAGGAAIGLHPGSAFATLESAGEQ